MDGNGRWAAARDLPRTEGHKAGVQTARVIMEECIELGVKYLTLYTFSRENWSRPKAEVSFLFDLLVDFLSKELPALIKNGVKLNPIGEIQALPFSARKTLEHATKRTASGDKLTLNLALNYSGREEITLACKKFLNNGGKPDELTPEKLSSFLYTGGQPDPDLVIRTSGEMRVSNFLLFQSAYSEYYFTQTLWPDFTPDELRRAVAEFSARNRRFGGI